MNLRRLALYLGWLLLLGPVGSARADGGIKFTPDVKYDAKKFKLELHIPPDIATMLIDATLNRFATGTVVDTSTSVVKISNFRSSLGVDGIVGGKVVIRFDYTAKQRGWTKNQAHAWGVGPERIYGNWVSDSGHIQAPIFIKVTDWQLHASTNQRAVIDSNHNVTNWLLEDITVQMKAKGAIYEGITSALRGLLGESRTMDLRQFLLDFGPAEIASAVGMSEKQVRNTLTNKMNNIKADAFIKKDGIHIVFDLELAFFSGLSIVDPNSSLKGLVKKPTTPLSADDFKIKKPSADPQPPNLPKPPDTKPTVPVKPPEPTKPAVPPKTIQCEFVNSTTETVSFRLNGGTGLTTSLAPGKNTRFNVVVDPGVPAAVYIKQKNGAELNFALKDGDRYAFLVQNGKIVNSYR